MESSKLQTRYAQSLFDLAVENSLTESVYEDMSLVKKVCAENTELKAVLKNPIIKPSRKKAIIDGIFGEKIQELTASFLNLLINKRRDIFLYEIADRFTELYKESKGIKTVVLITADKLDPVFFDEILKYMEKSLNSKVDLELRVNPKLIGGFCILFDGKQYDASFLNQFVKLKKEFSDNIYEKIF